MTGQPRTVAEIVATYIAALDKADADYDAIVANINATADRRTSQELDHMDRRVLDPAQQAHARRINDTWIVTAGLGTIIATDRDHAWTVVLTHNAICGFFPAGDDRRTS